MELFQQCSAHLVICDRYWRHMGASGNKTKPAIAVTVPKYPDKPVEKK